MRREGIFNKRLKYKKQHNPLEQLYKSIMNNSYGKMIEKSTETEIKIIKNSDYDSNFQKNSWEYVLIRRNGVS